MMARPMTRSELGKEAEERSSTPPASRSRFQAQPGCRVVLGERDEALLTDLFLHGVLSRSQVQALHFGSVPRCNARLRQLFDGGFVSRYFLPLARYGSEAIYSLGTAAIPWVAASLARDGHDVDAALLRKSCQGGLAPLFLEHTLAITDFYLALRTAALATPSVSLERWLPELLCRHEYDVRASGGGSWRREVFKPDGFVRLAERTGAEDTPRYLPYFVEIDRGHVSSSKFLGKLQGHQRYWESGLYAETYGSASFRTLVVTTSPKRLSNLRHLAEDEHSELFWLTTADAVTQQGAFAPIWHVPNHAELRSLLT